MALDKNYFVTDPNYQVKDNQVIKIRNLKVNFKAKDGLLQAVRGVNITVYKGQIVGIVGESGSGKSVCVKSLLGFNDNAITEADALNLLDIDLTKITKKGWLYVRGTYITYISQDPLSSLNPTKKIGAQILEAIYVAEKRKLSQKKYDLKKSWQQQKISQTDYQKSVAQAVQEYKQNTNSQTAYNKVLEILTFIGIENAAARLNYYPHEFSGGMRQRIAIAIAVATRPDVIIADEPTTALDVTIQAQVLKLIQDLKKLYQVTVIFISHNIALVANFCEYVYVMYAGKIVEQGTVAEIFTKPLHPYTWALFACIPDLNMADQKLIPIPGTAANLIMPPKGDAFAARNKYALKIDFEKQPPLFWVSKTHAAATWLLHDKAPKIPIPEEVLIKIKNTKEIFKRI